MAPDNDEWWHKLIMGVAGAVAIAAVFWAGGFVKQITLDGVDMHITDVMTQQLPAVADPIYLRRVVFEDYAQKQIDQANESQLRIIEQEIVRVQGELQYSPSLSEGRRAQLELQLHTLEIQREELMRKLH